MNTNRIKMSEAKELIKKLAIEIKETKKEIKKREKERQYAGAWQSSLIREKSQYRELLIAYSLAKGRTLEQIESKHKVDENKRRLNPPNMSNVNAILAGLLMSEGELA